ncbi:MAG TPA: hypothetical protein PLI97_10590, partial [Fluviicola sp.]|nr:hypothetical protein [Fluviicola sp.]
MKALKKYHWLILVIFTGVSFLVACTKNKTPKPTTPPELTKWEKIAGHYKVYDTTGVYLYDMDLIHIHNNNTNRDSIKFVNFDGEFSFTVKQEEYANYPMYVAMGVHNLLYDSNHK